MVKYIMDIEADNLLLDVTKIHCMVLKDIDTNKIYTFKEDEMKLGIDMLSKADLIIAHNGVMYDLPVLYKFYGLEIDITKVFDTLLISRVLLPDRMGGHSLKAWGERVGSAKGDFTDFSKYSEEMLEYCIQDVNVTHKIFEYLRDGARQYYNAVLLEHKFANVIVKQIQSGFKLDVVKVTELYNEYDEERISLINTLSAMMPKVKELSHYRLMDKKGLIMNETDKEYTYITEKSKIIKTKEFKLHEPNPTSRQQIAAYLKSKGWVPQEFTDSMQPKIDETVLKALPYTEAKLFAQLFYLQKAMGMIKNDKGGWLNYVREGNRVHGDIITNGTNTGRCSHSKPNLAQVSKKDSRMREVWIPNDGMKLVDCDAAGLELRVLAHYLAHYDRGAYAYEVVNGDIHTHNQRLMGMETRDAAKRGIYALIYGAGNLKLGSVYMEDINNTNCADYEMRNKGKSIRENILDGLTGYKGLTEDVTDAYKKRGNLHGLDGRPLFPRNDYSALNLLIQSAGAIIMKQALINFYDSLVDNGYKYGVDYKFVANVHDEYLTECREEIAEHIKELSIQGIVKAGRDLNLKVCLDGDARIGNNWAEIH